MEQRVSLITLGVRELERSRRFYEALGWKTAAAPSEDVVFFQAGGFIVALWDRAKLAEDSGVPDGGGWGGVTLAYNVNSPPEVDQPRLAPIGECSVDVRHLAVRQHQRSPLRTHGLPRRAYASVEKRPA
jgi:catechol 2,3-dioxygenase-like lactoylglutathione lyase family enzyme